MIDVLEMAIRARWAELRLPGKPPTKLEFFLSAGVAGKHGKVLYHVFRAGESKPLFLGKIPRDGTARQWAMHEHEFLKVLEEAAPRLSGRRFPRALLVAESGARVATGQTIVPGVPLDRKLAEWGSGEAATRRLYDLAKDWLEEFWRETGLIEGTEGALWEPFLRSAHFFLETWEPEPTLRDAVESIIREIEARADGSVLCGFGHGDFLATNLIADGDKISAVDWEFGEKRQLPWFDPMHFAVDLAIRQGQRAGLNRRAGVERTFYEKGWRRDRCRAFLEACLSEGGVPMDVLPLALPAYFLFSTHRMARFFSAQYPVTVAWKEIVERSLRPGAREAWAGNGAEAGAASE